ncbi:MAG TPA: endonuclease/exonuclease/phosphatase family protein [Bacteriovoracaceae bacterium]|nr:endonuclease/exonuclease/phosphatase family protein [Bacteriovoracaceae bacterium]
MKRIFTLLLMLCIHLGAYASSHDLRIASYNIKGLPFPIQINHTARYKAIVHEIRAMENQGQGPDVILVQEAFSVMTRYVHKHLKDIYPYKARGPGNRIKWNSGLEILSKYPITRATITTFGSCDSFDCLARKGVLFTRIKLPGTVGEVDIYNTHMQANNGPRAPFAEKVRNDQTETMIQFINNTHEKNLPMFIGGDLNTKPQAANYARFMEEFGDIDTRRFCQTTNICDGFNLFGDSYWDSRIDHIFYSSGDLGVTPKDYESFFKDTDYSDHAMFKGTYQLGK